MQIYNVQTGECGKKARKKVTLKWKFAKNFVNAPRTSSLMKIC